MNSMRRYIIALVYLVSINCFSQSNPVLVRINGVEISRSEFQYYYQKFRESGNQPAVSSQEYMDEFINNKLKIAEAISLGLDGTDSFQSEMKNYHRQLTRKYLLAEKSTGSDAYSITNPIGRNTATVEGYHIYKYLPQNTPVYEVNRVNARFDSLYNVIARDPAIDFYQIVEKYSDDKNIFIVNPYTVPEEFENVVFTLQADEVSKPFFTPQGIHIVKIHRKYDAPLLKQKEYLNKRPVKYSTNHNAALDEIKNDYNFVVSQTAVSELLSAGSTQYSLFTIDGRPYTVTEFERFSQDNPRKIEVRLEEFIAKSLYDYELTRLEIKHPEFNTQMNWYRDEILLYEINNRKLGDSRTVNPVDLEDYFNKNKKDYYWDLPRYKGIVVHCENKRTGKKIKKQLKKIHESQWVEYINQNYNNSSQQKALFEYGTFAVGQNDYIDKMVFKVGKSSPIPSHPFTIVAGRKVKGPESYEEISERIFADYRNSLETRWIRNLHSKSKVEINQEVLKTVNNQ